MSWRSIILHGPFVDECRFACRVDLAWRQSTKLQRRLVFLVQTVGSELSSPVGTSTRLTSIPSADWGIDDKSLWLRLLHSFHRN